MSEKQNSLGKNFFSRRGFFRLAGAIGTAAALAACGPAPATEAPKVATTAPPVDKPTAVPTAPKVDATAAATATVQKPAETPTPRPEGVGGVETPNETEQRLRLEKYAQDLISKRIIATDGYEIKYFKITGQVAPEYFLALKLKSASGTYMIAAAQDPPLGKENIDYKPQDFVSGKTVAFPVDIKDGLEVNKRADGSFEVIRTTNSSSGQVKEKLVSTKDSVEWRLVTKEGASIQETFEAEKMQIQLLLHKNLIDITSVDLKRAQELILKARGHQIEIIAGKLGITKPAENIPAYIAFLMRARAVKDTQGLDLRIYMSQQEQTDSFTKNGILNPEVSRKYPEVTEYTVAFPNFIGVSNANTLELHPGYIPGLGSDAKLAIPQLGIFYRLGELSPVVVAGLGKLSNVDFAEEVRVFVLGKPDGTPLTAVGYNFAGRKPGGGAKDAFFKNKKDYTLYEQTVAVAFERSVSARPPVDPVDDDPKIDVDRNYNSVIDITLPNISVGGIKLYIGSALNDMVKPGYIGVVLCQRVQTVLQYPRVGPSGVIYPGGDAASVLRAFMP